MYETRHRYRERERKSTLYDTLLYQIAIVAILVTFLWVATQSGNPMLQEIVADLRDKATISIPLPKVLQGEDKFGYHYMDTLLGKDQQKQEGMGGKPNPLFGVQKNKKIKAPTGSSLSPILITSPMGLPVSGKITSPYGYREHPITEKADFHTGLDIAAPQGTAIVAPLNGVVLDTGNSNSYGNYIQVKHSNGLVTHYYHCSEILAQQGTVVRKGDRIAKVGSTGISTGPHLHFEVRHQGIAYDPLWLLVR